MRLIVWIKSTVYTPPSGGTTKLNETPQEVKSVESGGRSWSQNFQNVLKFALSIFASFKNFVAKENNLADHKSVLLNKQNSSDLNWVDSGLSVKDSANKTEKIKSGAVIFKKAEKKSENTKSETVIGKRTENLKSNIPTDTDSKLLIGASFALKEIFESELQHLRSVEMQCQILDKMVNSPTFMKALSSVDAKKLIALKEQMSNYFEKSQASNTELQKIFSEYKDELNKQDGPNPDKINNLLNKLEKYYKGTEFSKTYSTQEGIYLANDDITAFASKYTGPFSQFTNDNFEAKKLKTGGLELYTFQPSIPAFQRMARNKDLVGAVNSQLVKAGLVDNPAVGSMFSGLSNKVSSANNKKRALDFNRALEKHPLPELKDIKNQSRAFSKSMKYYRTPSGARELDELCNILLEFRLKPGESPVKPIENIDTKVVVQQLVLIDSAVQMRNIKEALKNKGKRNSNVDSNLTRLKYYSLHFPDLVSAKEVQLLEDEVKKQTNKT